MSLAELFGQMSDMEEESTMTEKQTVSALRKCFEAISEQPQVFTPGEIVLHKFPDHSTTKSASGPAIFIGYLDKPFDTGDRTTVTDPTDWHGTACCEHIDCKVGLMSGRRFVVFHANSAHYRLHPDHLTGGKN